jgi:hypothetical protein
MSLNILQDIPTQMLDMGVDATLGGLPVRGLLDADPVLAFGALAGSNPIFTLATSDVPPDPRTLVLAVTGGDTFTVQDWNDDGHGLTTLQLQESGP